MTMAVSSLVPQESLSPYTYIEAELPRPNVSRLSSSSSEYSTDEKNQEGNNDGAIVVKRHRVATYLRYWIHFAAILVTGGLAALNILNVFMMDVDDAQSNTKLNLFQFAAKAHEVLIIGSMMLIMMDYVRSRLITAKGVPLGYILFPVLFNGHDWVLSTEFWSCVAKPSLSTLPLTTLILTAIPFANFAGPLSAILVVPRLGWSKPQPAAVFSSFFNSSASRIWPDTVKMSDLLDRCDTGSGQSISQCPAAAIETLFESTHMSSDQGSTSWNCLNKGTQMSCNSTFDRTHTLSLEYDFYSLSPAVSSQRVDVFSPLKNRVTSGLARSLNISGTTNLDADKAEVLDLNFFGDGDLLKPAVQTVCSELNYSSIYQLYKDSNISYNWSTPAAFWLKNIDSSPRPSFLFSWMKNDSLLVDAERCEAQYCFSSVACTVDARWVPVRFWYNMQQSDVLYQSDPQPSELIDSRKFYDGIPITIAKEVLELTTIPRSVNMSEVFRDILNDNSIPQTNRPENVVLFPDAISSGLFLVNYTQAVAMMLSVSIVEFLAYGPSRTGQSTYDGNCSDTTFGFDFGNHICSQNPDYWIHINSIGDLESDFSMVSFTLRKNGYGCFFDGITVKIALGIMLLHALLTVLYLAFVVTSRRQLTTCWSSAPELLTLAINSLRAPVLMGHSMGVNGQSRNIWREHVMVREIDSGEELSLVVGDPMDYSGRIGDLPQVGKKYN